MPFVSVIMPAFCASATLRQSVQSMMRQTWADWELVIVNDASDDGTGELAESLASKDSRIRVLHNSTNLGAAAAMNRAWRDSASPFVAIMDADDVALAVRLELQTDHMKRNPRTSVLGAAAHFVEHSGAYLRTVRPPQGHQALVRRRWRKSPFIHPTVLMRREFLEATGGYQDGIRLGEDYDLWMRGFQLGGVTYENLETPLVVYRTRTVQRWEMIRASARVRLRAGARESRRALAYWAAARILAEGLIEQTGVFSQLQSRKAQSQKPADLSILELG